MVRVFGLTLMSGASHGISAGDYAGRTCEYLLEAVLSVALTDLVLKGKMLAKIGPNYARCLEPYPAITVRLTHQRGLTGFYIE